MLEDAGLQQSEALFFDLKRDIIWQLGGGNGLVQVTVAAADIVTADVLATAIVSGGTPTLNLATDNWDVAVLAIRADGSMLATPAFQYA